MAGAIAQAGVARAVARFPRAAAVAWQLAGIDPEFRALCEEYALAQDSLARFEARPDAAERPEVVEYRSVIADLETEIGRFLGEAGTRG